MLVSHRKRVIYRIMPELQGLYINNDQRAQCNVIIFKEAEEPQALSNLMHLSIVLEPASHYCGH